MLEKINKIVGLLNGTSIKEEPEAIRLVEKLKEDIYKLIRCLNKMEIVCVLSISKKDVEITFQDNITPTNRGKATKEVNQLTFDNADVIKSIASALENPLLDIVDEVWVGQYIAAIHPFGDKINDEEVTYVKCPIPHSYSPNKYGYDTFKIYII